MLFRSENRRGVVTQSAGSGPYPAYIDDFSGPPVRTRWVEPILTPELQVAMPKGASRVIAELQINSMGRVVHACVMRTDAAVLDEPALTAVRQWHYRLPVYYRHSIFPYFKTATVVFKPAVVAPPPAKAPRVGGASRRVG